MEEDDQAHSRPLKVFIMAMKNSLWVFFIFGQFLCARDGKSAIQLKMQIEVDFTSNPTLHFKKAAANYSSKKIH